MTLPPSQTRVLEMLARGHTTPTIARETGWSLDTVKWTLRAARDRLDARNSTHAVAIAIRRGLLT